MTGTRKETFRSMLFRPALVLVAALIASLAIATSTQAAGTCVTKPDITPESDLVPGTMGTAYTVVQGRTIVSFDVEVLGILGDGIAPGIDFILIKTSGPVIDATGGIAAGMSGSPVYVGGKLAGSVSYGFWDADQTIGGMTPAESIIKVFDYPGASAATIELTPSLRRAAAASLGESVASVPGEMAQIRVPVSVSGMTTHQLLMMQAQMDDRALPFTLYKGSSAPAPMPGAPVDPLVPGSSFAAAASYGEVTYAGIGTTTAVCGDEVMAWGHPFFHDGTATYGMSAADIIAVVPDPSQIGGPFKLGSVAETVGSVDEDRQAGIHGIQGQMPSLVPVTSHIENPDLGTSMDGETDIADRDITPDYAWAHFVSAFTTAFDSQGGGTTTASYTVNGETKGGTPFQFDYSNMYYADWWAPDEAGWVFYEQLSEIQYNGFEKVTFTSIDIGGSITEKDLSSEIVGLESASPITPAIRERGQLRAKPGQTVTLRVLLDPTVGPNYSVDILYKVPRWAQGSGPLKVAGGQEGGYHSRSDGHGKPANFTEYLDRLGAGARNNDIVVALFPRGQTAADVGEFPQDHMVGRSAVVRLLLVK